MRHTKIFFLCCCGLFSLSALLFFSSCDFFINSSDFGNKANGVYRETPKSTKGQMDIFFDFIFFIARVKLEWAASGEKGALFSVCTYR
ncbi:hypothetical protein V8C35DRAFT_27220 [Trichoderma chlorosporum]